MQRTERQCRLRRWTLVLLLGVGIICCTEAATPYTESFASSLSGWTNSGLITWTPNSGMLRAIFPVAPGPPAGTASLNSSPAASGGAFTGDYVAADILLMGFSFKADNVLPDLLIIEWYGGTNSVYRELKGNILATGSWYRFAFSLSSAAEGGWFTSVDADTFAVMQTNVTSLSIKLEGSSDSLAPRYWLDDVFIDRGHQAGQIRPTTNGYGEVTWNYVRSNYTYRLEYADALAAGWSTAAVVTATSTNLVSSVSLTNAANRAFRLVLP